MRIGTPGGGSGAEVEHHEASQGAARCGVEGGGARGRVCDDCDKRGARDRVSTGVGKNIYH
jgi:hypothetical protein